MTIAGPVLGTLSYQRGLISLHSNTVDHDGIAVQGNKAALVAEGSQDRAGDRHFDEPRQCARVHVRDHLLAVGHGEAAGFGGDDGGHVAAGGDYGDRTVTWHFGNFATDELDVGRTVGIAVPRWQRFNRNFRSEAPAA